jgi:hypothetical protein
MHCGRGYCSAAAAARRSDAVQGRGHGKENEIHEELALRPKHAGSRRSLEVYPADSFARPVETLEAGHDQLYRAGEVRMVKPFRSGEAIKTILVGAHGDALVPGRQPEN